MRMERKRSAGPPEDSVVMRCVVAALVEISILAVVAQHAVDGATAVFALVLAPLGYWVSYRRRHRSNLVLKLALSLGLFVAMGQFLQRVQVVGSVDAARIPLASLFLWVQVLHAFDVPRRRDLAFSVVSSLILIAEAGALSLTTNFIAFLVPWLALAGTWLYLSSRPRADRLAAPVATATVRSRAARTRVAPARAAAMPALAALLAAGMLFLAMPRIPGSFVKTPPFSFSHATTGLPNFDGGVSNPGLPPAGGNGVVDFASGAYPGFSDRVDLQARGRLSDQIAFRVRASQASLWRAEAFDVYDGTTWTIGSKQTTTLEADDAPGAFRTTASSMWGPALPVPSVPLTQTFYVETQQPNILFTAAVPSQVYFPSAGLRQDRYGSIRAPILLDPGLVYSVVSDVPITDEALLRRAGRAFPRQLASYLQVPSSLPARVGAFARQTTAGTSTEYDAVIAVQSWIQQHTRYNLDVPPDPVGVDSVDHFLFVTRQGFCEQIASSMAVTLRTLGIPTRLVTGYGPGQRNPFTGYFEVKQSDAHAWLEVYYPGIGWVPYDPTFGVPEAAPSVGSRFMAGPVFAAIGRFAQRAVPQPVKRAAGVAIGAVRDTAALAVRAWPLALLVLAAAAMAVAMWRRRRARLALGPPPEPAEAAFLDLARALEPAGHARREEQTPGEYLRGLQRDAALDPGLLSAAELIVRTFERARFAPEPAKPSQEDVMRARAMVARVRELAHRR